MLFAFVIFLVVAAGGGVLAAGHLRKKQVAAGLRLLHGLGAVGALGLLVNGVLQAEVSLKAKVATGMFGVALCGGLLLFALGRQRERGIPPLMIAMHGLLAVASIAVLGFALFGS